MKYLKIISFFTLALTMNVTAQDVAFSKANFPEASQELKAARKAMKEGDKIVGSKRPDYSAALEKYLLAQNFNPNNAQLNRSIGECYLKMLEAGSAIPYLLRSLELAPGEDLQMARAYHLNSEFADAESRYKSYLNSLTGKQLEKDSVLIKHYLRQVELGKEIMDAARSAASVNHIEGHINTRYDEFMPLLAGTDSFWCFSSNRYDGNARKAKRKEPLESTYFVRAGMNGAINVERSSGRFYNDEHHFTAVFLSPDGRKIYFRHGGQPDELMAYCLNAKGKWKKDKSVKRRLMKEGPINSFAVSPDNSWVAFTAESKRGKYGSDLYLSKMGKKGWEKPWNAGDVFNTRLDEAGVSFTADGKRFYFASSGLPGIGGFDLFFSELSDSGWTPPRNAGIPLNSPFDDISIAFDGKGEQAILCSNRQGGFGGYDLYEVSLPGDIPEPILISRELELQDTIVLDPAELELPYQTILPVDSLQSELTINLSEPSHEGMNLYMASAEDGRITWKPIADSTGQVIIRIPNEGEFLCMAFSGKVASDLIVVEPKAILSEGTPVIELPTTQTDPGNGIWIRSLAFAAGSDSTLKPSNATVQMLVKFLETNPLLLFELVAFVPADSADDASAMALAQSRANRIAEMLYNEGISKEQIIPRGQVSIQSQADLKRASERLELIRISRVGE